MRPALSTICPQSGPEITRVNPTINAAPEERHMPMTNPNPSCQSWEQGKNRGNKSGCKVRLWPHVYPPACQHTAHYWECGSCWGQRRATVVAVPRGATIGATEMAGTCVGQPGGRRRTLPSSHMSWQCGTLNGILNIPVENHLSDTYTAVSVTLYTHCLSCTLMQQLGHSCLLVGFITTHMSSNTM